MSPPAVGLHKLAAPAGFEPTLLGSEPSTLTNYVKEQLFGINEWIRTTDPFHVKEVLLPAELH